MITRSKAKRTGSGSGSVSSKASVIAQQLAAKAEHARRIADLENKAELAEAERARAAAARERSVAELELQAELAAIEASASARSSQRSQASSKSREQVVKWLDTHESIFHEPISPQVGQNTLAPATAGVARAPHPVSTLPVTAGQTPPDEVLGLAQTYHRHEDYTPHLFNVNQSVNKNIVSSEATQNQNDIRMLAATIADLATSRPRVSDKLPYFDGRTADWLAFKRVYADTRGAYTTVENLARLNSAIRGVARDTVSTLLVSARDPNQVMAMLELRFAQPELIILQEISAVRNLPKLPSDPAREINLFACRVRNCVETIKLLNQAEYLASPELYNCILAKLSPLLRSRWADFAISYSGPNRHKLELLSDFLAREAELQMKFGLISEHTLEFLRHENVKGKKSERVHAIDSDSVVGDCYATSSTQTSSKSDHKQPPYLLCLFCQSKSHTVDECEKFHDMSIDDRWHWVLENKVCRKCLKKNKHSFANCKVRCQVEECSYKRSHHTLLHNPKRETSAHADTELKENPASSETEVLVAHSCNSSERSLRPLLKIVPVTVSGPKGKVETYALLDDGSTATFIDSTIASAVGAKGPSSFIILNCIGGLSKSSEVVFVELTIKGRHSTKTHNIKNVRAITNLGIGPQSARADDIKNFSHLSDLVEHLCYEDAKPTLIIGVDNWHLTLPLTSRQGKPAQPVAVETALGWVLFGFRSSKSTPVHFVNHAFESNYNHDHEIDSCESLESLIKENYRLDSIGITKKDYRSASENHALHILDDTTRRLPVGRFEVGLIWRPDIKQIHIPNSYDLALSRFLNLEKKFKKDEVYAKSYRDYIQATISKGYAELCTEVPQPISWYLPHFGVIHPQKRKLRVVHDAAAKSRGISLNNLLLPGPDLLQSLLAILMRFREGQIALCGDIREMFPQVKIRKEDRDAQRFLWRDSPSEPIREFRMSSMIFGASSSPCTAIYIKNRNAEEHKDRYPEAYTSIIQDHYMDDFLGSVHTVSQAAQLASDIVSVHKAGGFEMRAWVSNSKDALSLLPSELVATGVSEIGLGPSKNYVRVLGVTWNIESDTLCFLRDLPDKLPEKLTKRSVLSQLMRVYDPLGLLAPIVIRGRIYFQQTWKIGLDWDQELPSNLVQKWSSWFTDLKKLTSSCIPRCYCLHGTEIDCQLHIFADASENAYACVAYWRFCYANGNVKVSLIGGKARLAPLKPTSIPRLELQAALLAARFAAYITEAHRFKPSTLFYWTDSLTVLRWLRSDVLNFKPFVAHRVGEILETTNVSNWKFVPSASNVADDATRAETKFDTSSRWFSGPTFLAQSFNDWPSEPTSEAPPILEELKNPPLLPELVAATSDDSLKLPSPVVAEYSRFSEWIRLVRATARIRKCADKFRSILLCKKDPNSKLYKTAKKKSSLEVETSLLSTLSAEDINKAEKNLLLQAQLDCFKTDMACLAKSKPVTKQSRLANISVFLDSDKLLRLSGRIKTTENIPSSLELNPIVLDGKHGIIRLLIRHYHLKYAHANNETVVNELRQRFYIISLRTSVKKVAKDCSFCRLRNTGAPVPPFGDLPEGRLARESRPFSHVGLDYFGPVTISIGRRTEKRYVALFMCLTVRAVHLEIVSSLTSDSAIMALRRFIARRGSPIRIYSDNGTAFVGASRMLQDVFNFASNNRIFWSFIPPAAPFMGGCWERMVRSIKTALSVTLKDRHPKEEVLSTLLLEAEAIVNSRPLTHVSVASEDEEALSPFHFILGTSSNDPLPKPLSDSDLSSRQGWKKGLRLADHFWQRWTKEYLPTLLPRPSARNSTPIKCGDVVLVVDGTLPRGSWPLGRVTKVWPGKDGIVRVAEVKTKGGLFKRAVRLLVPVVQSPS